MTTLHEIDWSTLPVPEDDGAAAHLPGMRLAPVALRSTHGSQVDLSALPGRTIVYVYPLTGRPGVALPAGWDMTAGARGCTPQACSFRDHFSHLEAAGADHLFGLSTQDTAYQQEAASRLHLPFALLSDSGLRFAEAMCLPTFSAAGMTLLKRLTLVIRNGAVEQVFYPVFPPDRDPLDVLAYLSAQKDEEGKRDHPASSLRKSLSGGHAPEELSP